jgi:hypothetical protein
LHLRLLAIKIPLRWVTATLLRFLDPWRIGPFRVFNFRMSNRIRVEIVGRNEFWRNAVFVEWEYQFPERKLEPDGAQFHLIEKDWLEDLQRVAAQCFSRALLAPQDPGRRHLFRRIFEG